MIFIPWFISRSSRKQKPIQYPKCPNCKKILKDWMKPIDSRLTFSEAIITTVIGILFILNIAGLLIGAIDGTGNICDAFLSKRYHYLIPVQPLACHVSHWLNR